MSRNNKNKNKKKKPFKLSVQSKYAYFNVSNLNEYTKNELKNIISQHSDDVNIKFKTNLPGLRLQADNILSNKLKQTNKKTKARLKPIESMTGIQIINLASQALDHQFSIKTKTWFLAEEIDGKTIIKCMQKQNRDFIEHGDVSFNDNFQLSSFVEGVGEGTINIDTLDSRNNPFNPLPAYNNNNNNSNNQNVNNNNSDENASPAPPPAQSQLNSRNKRSAQSQLNKEEDEYFRDEYAKRGRGGRGGYFNSFGRGGGARAGYGGAGGYGGRDTYDYGHRHRHRGGYGHGGYDEYDEFGDWGHKYSARGRRGGFTGGGRGYGIRGAGYDRRGFGYDRRGLGYDRSSVSLPPEKKEILQKSLDSELFDIYLNEPSREYQQKNIIKQRWLNQRCSRPFRRKPFEPIVDLNDKGKKCPAKAFQRLAPDMKALGWFGLSRSKPKSATLKVNEVPPNPNAPPNDIVDNEESEAKQPNKKPSESEKALSIVRAKGGWEKSKVWVIRLNPVEVDKIQNDEEKEQTQRIVIKHNIKTSKYCRNYWGEEAVIEAGERGLLDNEKFEPKAIEEKKNEDAQDYNDDGWGMFL